MGSNTRSEEDAKRTEPADTENAIPRLADARFRCGSFFFHFVTSDRLAVMSMAFGVLLLGEAWGDILFQTYLQSGCTAASKLKILVRRVASKSS